MTIEQCYAQMGGSFAEVSARLPSTRLIEKFVRKFPEDPSYAQLKQALAENSLTDAFRAAHTLKGVAANLGLERLRAAAADMTERLRSGDLPGAQALLAETEAAYRQVLDAIEGLN